MIDKIRELREQCGRGDDALEVHVISLDAFDVDGLLRLDELGVTDVIVGFSNPYTREADVEPLQSKVDSLRRYAETTMADYRRRG